MEQAVVWYRKAAELECEEAVEALKRLGRWKECSLCWMLSGNMVVKEGLIENENRQMGSFYV